MFRTTATEPFATTYASAACESARAAAQEGAAAAGAEPPVGVREYVARAVAALHEAGARGGRVRGRASAARARGRQSAV